MPIFIPGLALLALAQLAQADSVARPQLDSAWCTALTAELPGTANMDNVPLWLRVDRWGRVDSVRVDSSAAQEETPLSLLELAARELRFMPWEDGPAWTLVRYPIPVRDSAEAQTVGPAFAPSTRRPELKDRQGAAGVVLSHITWNLQEEGLFSTITVSAFVDTTGAVVDVVTLESSRSRKLDEAVERGVWEFEFTPALNRGRRVPAWTSLPIHIETIRRRHIETIPRRHIKRSPPEFILGPRHDPVAEATLMAPDSLDAPPDLIRPDEARERLSRAYLDSGPAEDLGLIVTLEVGRDGLVRTRLTSYRVGGAEWYHSTVAAIYSELKRLRFRPGVVAGEPQATTFSAWLVFSRYLGLAPSLPSSNPCPSPPAAVRERIPCC